jgi:prepilin peptidase CpaA
MSTESPNFINFSIYMARLNLILPLLLALWMAWSDVRTNRIPNYLTLLCALGGLAYQFWINGLSGLGDGFLGMALGFGLLIFFYARGGIGAGDVKALAALGTWLGPLQTAFLFVYMAISGVILIVIFLWWRGLLWGKMRQFWGYLVNWVLLRSSPPMPRSAPSPTPNSERMPYGLAIAMGMAFLCWYSFTN